MKKWLILMALPFLLIIGSICGILMLFSGGDADKPIPPPCTLEQSAVYFTECVEIGVPWDLVMLIDTFLADEAGLPDIEGVNPLLTALNFKQLTVRYSSWEAVGEDSEGNSIYRWVYDHTGTFSGRDAILSELGLGENVTAKALADATEDYDDDYSDSKKKRESAMASLPAASYGEIIADYYSDTLTQDKIDGIIELFGSNYLYLLYMPEGGSNGTHALIRDLIAGDTSPAPTGDYASPVDGDWRSRVSCEINGYPGHTGMDLALPVGTPIHAAAGGTVLFVRRSGAGYGNHLAIHHGGGVVTLYAHCSELRVDEGDRVSRGEVIALSGNTGRSTGPHLHIEFVIDGEPQNPRGYLP